MEVVIKPWLPDTIPLLKLSQLFTEFYKRKPWNEYLYCPSCKQFGDFGPIHTYGFEECEKSGIVKCPICGSQLIPFWSEDRLYKYIFETNEVGEVIFIDGDPAAWWRGRRIDSGKTLYLDVIAILPEFRHTPFREVVIDYFRNEINRYRLEKGITRFLSRTHKRMTHVRLFLKIFGFVETEASIEDPDRSYWVLTF